MADSKSRNRSLFHPSGPLTSRNVRNREALTAYLAAHGSGSSDLSRKPPPNKATLCHPFSRAAAANIDAQVQGAELFATAQKYYWQADETVPEPMTSVPRRLPQQHPARLAGQAILELKRDLNDIFGPRRDRGPTILDKPLQRRQDGDLARKQNIAPPLEREDTKRNEVAEFQYELPMGTPGVAVKSGFLDKVRTAGIITDHLTVTRWVLREPPRAGAEGTAQDEVAKEVSPLQGDEEKVPMYAPLTPLVIVAVAGPAATIQKLRELQPSELAILGSVPVALPPVEIMADEWTDIEVMETLSFPGSTPMHVAQKAVIKRLVSHRNLDTEGDADAGEEEDKGAA